MIICGHGCTADINTCYSTLCEQDTQIVICYFIVWFHDITLDENNGPKGQITFGANCVIQSEPSDYLYSMTTINITSNNEDRITTLYVTKSLITST